MKKLHIKLQTPVIEINATAEDASGVKDSLTIGFRRTTIKDADIQLEKFSKASGRWLQAVKNDAPEEDLAKLDEELQAVISDNVLFLKGVDLRVGEEESDHLNVLRVSDTRKAKKEDFWETPEECLAVLLDAYFQVAPWKSSLSTAFQQAMLNMKTPDLEGKIKN